MAYSSASRIISAAPALTEILFAEFMDLLSVVGEEKFSLKIRCV